MSSFGTLPATLAIAVGCCGLVGATPRHRPKVMSPIRRMIAAVAAALLVEGLWLAVLDLGWETAVPFFLAVLSTTGAAAVLLRPVAPAAIARLDFGAAMLFAVLTGTIIVAAWR